MRYQRTREHPSPDGRGLSRRGDEITKCIARKTTKPRRSRCAICPAQQLLYASSAMNKETPMNNEITTIASSDLDDVMGGMAWLGRLLPALSGLMGSGANGNAQIGNNQRSAQGNQGPVSVGDGSPINVTNGGGQ